jgi:hypothetical protein
VRLTILVLTFLAASTANCFGGVLYLNALPVNDLNDAAGDLRSNIAFGESDPTSEFDGTDVIFSTSVQISSISFWSVASNYGEALGNEFSSVSLYFRPVIQTPNLPDTYGTWEVLETGSPDTSFDVSGQPSEVGSSNPDMLFTQVSYTGAVTPENSYEGDGTPGVYYPLWQDTFNNVGLSLPSGTYEFAINGVGANPDPDTGYGYWYSSFVNGPLSGSPQSSETGTYLRCSYSDLSGPCFVENPQSDGTWNKPADMNIEIDGLLSSVPEPGTSAMLGIGLFAVGWLSRRRKA